jgi:hypothetical protein
MSIAALELSNSHNLTAQDPPQLLLLAGKNVLNHFTHIPLGHPRQGGDQCRRNLALSERAGIIIGEAVGQLPRRSSEAEERPLRLRHEKSHYLVYFIRVSGRILQEARGEG